MKRDREKKGVRAAGAAVEVLVAAGASLAVLFLYVLTLAPTVLYYSPETFDSAHLQVVAATLGIPSYTGYPTYAMLTHLFTYLPVGDVAYRVNLASAVYGALAVAVVYAAARVLGAGRLGAVAGALALGLSQTFWSQAVIAEVYTLHVLLAGLFLTALLVWRRDRQDRYLLLAAFLGGLAMTNHLTSLFLLPSAVLFVAVVDRSKLMDPWLLVRGAGFFGAGLLPYLYLPVRAEMSPPLVDAGPAGNPSTWAGLFDLVSGGEHKARIFAFGPAELPGRVAIYLEHLIQNLNPVLLALAALGLVLLFFRVRAALVLLGAVYAFNLAYALEYDIEDLEIYFIPTYLVLCLALAVAASAVIGWARAWSAYAAPVAALLVFGAVAAGAPAAYAAVDRSEDYRGREIVETVAEGTKPGSTVLYHGRSLHYMQIVEGRRQDIRLEDPFYTGEWVEEAGRNLERGPVYVLYPGATNARLYKEAGYELVPVEEEMLYEVVER